MKQVIFGRLAGLEETSISLDTGKEGVKVYPRRELDVSLDWVFNNMGQQVVCMLQDGLVSEVKTLR